MKRVTAAFATAVLLMSIAMITSMDVLRAHYRRAERDVCELIDEHYYRRDEPKVLDWVRRCRSQAETDSIPLDKKKLIERINARIGELDVSHLTLYSPAENRLIWENQGLDTGIRSRIVDAFLIVTQVLPKSPAERSGVKLGDVLVGLNGQMIPSPLDAQTGSGSFAISRQGRDLQLTIEPEELMEDLSPSLEEFGEDVGVLKIPSFLAQYFEDGEWKALASRISRFKRLVIDLRGNAGGSFPGMLRALSPFRCEHPSIGEVYHSESGKLRGSTDLKNDLDTGSQLKQLNSARLVRLRTFEDYGCYRGPVTVLIDSDTSSVAEIFAQAFYSRANSRVWGRPSAGQVVMAQWFPIAALGGDEFSMSIPIAGYRTADGAELESQGLYPQRVLHYDVDLSLEGRDSWLEEAVKAFPAARARGRVSGGAPELSQTETAKREKAQNSQSAKSDGT